MSSVLLKIPRAAAIVNGDFLYDAWNQTQKSDDSSLILVLQIRVQQSLFTQ